MDEATYAVTQHQEPFRTQVHAMLAGTSANPPQLDEFFLDFDIPLRREEVERLGLNGDWARSPSPVRPRPP